jgi:hypothetical protein
MTVALLMIAGVVTARETRTEVTTATTPADNAKPNSNKVPDVYPIERKSERVFVLANADKAFGGHLEPGTIVFTYAIVTQGVLDDGVNFGRLDDKTHRWHGVAAHWSAMGSASLAAINLSLPGSDTDLRNGSA